MELILFLMFFFSSSVIQGKVQQKKNELHKTILLRLFMKNFKYLILKILIIQKLLKNQIDKPDHKMSNQAITLANLRERFQKELKKDNAFNNLLAQIETKTKVNREYIDYGK